TKVAHDLARRRYVHTFPGKFGGLELAEAACNLKLGEMIKQFEPMSLLECFDPVTNTCPLQGVCQLERALYESRQAFLEALNRYTLGDFLKPGASLAQRKARLGL
ncbi:MAG: Rrf2 family transcriptional regulator, partial [Bdellovibrionales bacterium]